MAVKAQIGCWLHERWQTEIALCAPLSRHIGLSWGALCNRGEHLRAGAERGTWLCPWDDSSCLTVASVFPRVGGRLASRCLEDFPVVLSDSFTPAPSPDVSVILPIGGRDRLDQFRGVVRSFMGQVSVNMEIIVSEYGNQPLCRGDFDDSVEYLFTQRRGEQFNKSIAMNEAVRIARAPRVLLHDADILVPARYLAELMRAFQSGWEAVRPVRFIFHLDPAGTRGVLEGSGWPTDISTVQQNNPGISTAVTTDAYWRIGGHDERFDGWGGEDLEFLDRLKTVRLGPGEWLPAVHLWHPDAPKKYSGDRNRDLMDELRCTHPSKRIADLTAQMN